jgi:hypothetical protein
MVDVGLSTSVTRSTFLIAAGRLYAELYGLQAKAYRT